jgi:hypothetical protein
MMKNNLVTILTIGGCAIVSTATLLVVEAIAGSSMKVSFYCGQTFDPNTNAIVPTTLVASSARREPVALIQWRSKLSGKYTPQVRCMMVSSKFQQAWNAKRLNYLMAGVDKQSGMGIICGTKVRTTACDRSSMLFTLANGADANETIDRIKEIKSGSGSNPLPQGSKGEDDLVEIENLIN